MDSFVHFALDHAKFLALLILPNYVVARLISARLIIFSNRRVLDSLGGRNDERSFYKGCRDLVVRALNEYERRDRKAGYYSRAKERLKKAGYRNRYAAFVYLLLKYVVSAVLVLGAVIMDYPEPGKAICLFIFLQLAIEGVVANKRRKLNLSFQRSVYKIYKYLHNQIASGVKVTDAVKTVYEVSDDNEIRDVLIHLSARFELTLDIDSALEEFSSAFSIQEADTLCVALKQGIETGDNRELLARQEEIMFKKYFNFVQAETDSCKLRSIAAAAIFSAVASIMVILPLLNEINDSLSKIFIN